VPLLKSKGGYVAAIGQAARPISGTSEDDLAILSAAFHGSAPAPALIVALGDQDFSSSGSGMGGTSYVGELVLAVYAISAHQKDSAGVDGRLAPDAVAARDPKADPGIETMLEHVRELLCGHELGITMVDVIRPRSEREVGTSADASVWEHRFVVRVELEVPQRADSDPPTGFDVQSELENP